MGAACVWFVSPPAVVFVLFVLIRPEEDAQTQRRVLHHQKLGGAAGVVFQGLLLVPRGTK